MITSKEIQTFIEQAHRFGNEKFMLCSSGNLSWRIGEHALVSGTGSWLQRLTEDKVAICDVASGNKLSDIRPSMESSFHLGIFRERPEINVVLHFQSEYATAVACMKDLPKNLNVTAEIPIHVDREIPVIEYLRPGSPELAEAVVEKMKNHNAVILANHGQVVCGKTFDEVYENAAFFEFACKIIIHTQGNFKVLTQKDIADLDYYVLGKTQK